MKKEEIQALFLSDKNAVCMIDTTECLSARELYALFDHQQWLNFTNVFDKSKEVRHNAGQSVSDHFANLSIIIDTEPKYGLTI